MSEFGENSIKIAVTCHNCGVEQPEMVVRHRQLIAWRNGAHAQDAFPHLSPPWRELLISGTCDDCFNRMFGEEED